MLGRPRHLPSFKLCSKEHIFLNLFIQLCKKKYISDFVFLPHHYCEYQSSEFESLHQHYIVPL